MRRSYNTLNGSKFLILTLLSCEKIAIRSFTIRLYLCTLNTGNCNGYAHYNNIMVTKRQHKNAHSATSRAFKSRRGRLERRDYNIRNYYSSDTPCLFIRLRIQVERLINK